MPTSSHLFVEHGIDPLLADVPADVVVREYGPAHPERDRPERFVRTVFKAVHGAEVAGFYPNLLEFAGDGGIRAVVGFRNCACANAFAEQYLDRPAEQVGTARLGQPVAREALVEVGNLAIADPGQARWVISAATAFLNAAGYRWVLFTATRPLANAFGRLGLKPLALADASPDRLPDRGATWGDYYRGGPRVYLGDIQAGCAKLHSHTSRPAGLYRLLDAARRLGDGLTRPVPVLAGSGL